MAEVGSTLSVLNVPEDVIKEVMTMLEENADALEQRKLNPIAGDAFGASSTGSQLAFDARLAQKVASKEIIEMVAGLRGYSQNIQKFADDVKDTDESNAATLKAFEAATEKVAQPTFSPSGQVPPAPEGGDN
ncbi:hypothetical protein [Nocardioides sp. LHG3406-4]|uniref:hypothetical protein n=1 Tax=Nocardioides sp. LHG3406-4 TaxID=2804575 RepID=UPI003CF94FC2